MERKGNYGNRKERSEWEVNYNKGNGMEWRKGKENGWILRRFPIDSVNGIDEHITNGRVAWSVSFASPRAFWAATYIDISNFRALRANM